MISEITTELEPTKTCKNLRGEVSDQVSNAKIRLQNSVFTYVGNKIKHSPGKRIPGFFYKSVSTTNLPGICYLDELESPIRRERRLPNSQVLIHFLISHTFGQESELLKSSQGTVGNIIDGSDRERPVLIGPSILWPVNINLLSIFLFKIYGAIRTYITEDHMV